MDVFHSFIFFFFFFSSVVLQLCVTFYLKLKSSVEVSVLFFVCRGEIMPL